MLGGDGLGGVLLRGLGCVLVFVRPLLAEIRWVWASDGGVSEVVPGGEGFSLPPFPTPPTLSARRLAPHTLTLQHMSPTTQAQWPTPSKDRE